MGLNVVGGLVIKAGCYLERGESENEGRGLSRVKNSMGAADLSEIFIIVARQSSNPLQ
jgi:hypothetical protein